MRKCKTKGCRNRHHQDYKYCECCWKARKKVVLATKRGTRGLVKVPVENPRRNRNRG